MGRRAGIPLPPFSAPDEQPHLYRAYHCSQGKLYASKCDGATGDDLPSSLTETYATIAGHATKDEEYDISWAKISKASQIVLDPQRRQFTVFNNTALYTPVPYLPQAAAIGVARFWGPAPLTLLYLARSANLVAYLLLAAAAVRITPIQKWTLAMVALVPMSVYLAASLSADAVTIGLSLLIIALTLKLALGGTSPAPAQAVSARGFTFAKLWDAPPELLLGFLLVLLALSKQAYLGMVMLFFLIPGRKFSSPRCRWLIAALTIGLPVVIDAAWSWSLRGLYVPMRSFVDPPAQFHWILGNPWSYAAALGKAMYRWDDFTFMIGAFGWLGPHLPRWIRDTYWIALLLTAVLDGGQPLHLGYRAKAVAAGVYAFTFAVMATFVYLSWEEVGARNIDGVQPRYLLPIIPLLLLLPRGSGKLAGSRLARTVVPPVAISIMVLAAACTCRTLVKRYY